MKVSLTSATQSLEQTFVDLNTIQLSPTIISTLKKELRLNHEVSALKTLVSEKQHKAEEIEASISVKEKVGIAKAAYYKKKEQIELLKESKEKDLVLTKLKVQEWRNHKLKIQTLLDTFLCENDLEYSTSEQVKQRYHELNTAVVLTNNMITELSNNLSEIRPIITTHYDSEKQAFRDKAQSAIIKISQYGYNIDASILQISNLVDAHNGQIKNTFLSKIVLPHLSPINVGDNIGTLRYQTLEQANHNITLFLKRNKELQEKHIPYFSSLIAQATNLHTEAAHHYVEQCWEQLRQKIWNEMHRTNVPFRSAATGETRKPFNPDKPPKLEKPTTKANSTSQQETPDSKPKLKLGSSDETKPPSRLRLKKDRSEQ